MDNTPNLLPLFNAILSEFENTGILEEMMLAGSWCQHVYRENLKESSLIPATQTNDIDFLLPNPFKSIKKVDISEILKKHDLKVDLDIETGSMRFIDERKDFKVEFITPEPGANKRKPYKIENLGIRASGIHYLEIPLKFSTIMNYRGHKIRVPEPEAYAMHKFIVAPRRKDKYKEEKDRSAAINISQMVYLDDDRIERCVEILNQIGKKRAEMILKEMEKYIPDLHDELKEKLNEIEKTKLQYEKPEWKILIRKGNKIPVFGKKSSIKTQHSFVEKYDNKYIPKLKTKTGKIIKISTSVSFHEVAKSRAEEAYMKEYCPEIMKEKDNDRGIDL